MGLELLTMYSKHMSFRLHGLSLRLTRIVVLIVTLLVFLMATHPVRVPALMLVAPFIIMFMILYYAALEVIRYFQPEAAEGDVPSVVSRPRLLAALLAGFPVLLLVLQSIMELNRWDVLIASAIFLLAYVMIARGLFISHRQ